MASSKTKVFVSADPLTDDEQDDNHGCKPSAGPPNNEVHPFAMMQDDDDHTKRLLQKAAERTHTPEERRSVALSSDVPMLENQPSYSLLVASEFPSASKTPVQTSPSGPNSGVSNRSASFKTGRKSMFTTQMTLKSLTGTPVKPKDGKPSRSRSAAFSMRETLPQLTAAALDKTKSMCTSRSVSNSSDGNKHLIQRTSSTLLQHLFHYQTTQKQLNHFRKRVADKGDDDKGEIADQSDNTLSNREEGIQRRRISRVKLLNSRASSLDLPNANKEDLTPEQAWRRFIILPTSHFWIVWNSLHLVVLGYLCAVAPYVAVLRSPERPYNWTDPINRVIDCFYLSDIIANFRAAFVDFQTGELVYNTREIAFTYLRGWFWFDALMTLPFDAIIPEEIFSKSKLPFALRLLRLIRLAKLIRILKANYLADFFEDHLGFNRNRLVMLELIGTIFIVAHFTACGFILVASMGGNGFDDTTSWVYMNHLNDSPANEIYVAALYWTFTMMTTVGFGDIVPCNYNERIYAVCGMVISAGTYAYVIASISSMVSLLNLSSTRYYEKLNELNAYMESRKLPMALQLKTRRFFRFYLTKKTAFDETTIFAGLPTNLRTELVEHYIKTVIKQNAFFHDIEKGFTSMIALVLKPAFFPPKSVIIVQEDIAEEMFIVTRGTLEVSVEVTAPHNNGKESRPLGNLNTGDHFGEMALICDPNNLHRMATVQTRTHCELHSLDYPNLKKGMSKYPLVRKKLQATAQVRLILMNNLKKAKMGAMFKSTGKSHGRSGVDTDNNQSNKSANNHTGHESGNSTRYGGGGASRNDLAQLAASAASQFVRFRKRQQPSDSNKSGTSAKSFVSGKSNRSGKSVRDMAMAMG